MFQSRLDISLKMKLIQILFLTLLCILTFSSASATVENEWKDFKIKFNKTYETPREDSKHFVNFKKNLDFIREQNEKKAMTFKVGVNENADLNDDDRTKTSKPLRKYEKF